MIEQKLAQIQKQHVATKQAAALSSSQQSTPSAAAGVSVTTPTSHGSLDQGQVQQQVVAELNAKLIEASNQVNTLKMDLQQARQQADTKDLENAELQAQLK